MKKIAKIIIKEIAIKCILGVSEKERSIPQKVIISLDLTFDIERASKTDNIADTVNYRTIYDAIVKKVSGSSFHLLEALASDILAYCLNDKRILQAVVRITKPSILEKAKSVTIEVSSKIERNEKKD